jgi:hypothetical protein
MLAWNSCSPRNLKSDKGVLAKVIDCFCKGGFGTTKESEMATKVSP